MSIKVYKDQAANSIFIEDANGAQFVNSLQASVPTTTVTITDLARQIDIVSSADHTEFVDENDNPYTGTAIDVCNTLNAIFQSSGTPTGDLPSITSPLTINSVEGSIINYELTASYGVGYEWDLSSVSGLTTVEGNVRKLVGGSSLAAGTYTIPVKAINYNGEDSETIVLTVSNPPFANTKSVNFNQNDYLNANGGILQNILGRTGNGSGSSDAWSVSLYFKAGTSNNQSQTILYAGNGNLSGNNHLRIYWNGNNVLRQQLCFRYGSNFNNLELKSPIGAITTASGWNHILISYDGGTTGSASGSVNAYYSRFKMFINGVQQSTVNTNQNFGNSNSLTVSEFSVGRYSTGTGYMRNNCKIDELAIWDSDQSANISNIYNSGSPLDLSGLSSSPWHWWRMGDGDTYPFLSDTGSQANCTFIMSNMTAADIVNDVP
jgi:hypothetical protein